MIRAGSILQEEEDEEGGGDFSCQTCPLGGLGVDGELYKTCACTHTDTHTHTHTHCIDPISIQ